MHSVHMPGSTLSTPLTPALFRAYLRLPAQARAASSRIVTTPSIKQMANRCFAFHATCLRAVRDQAQVGAHRMSTGELRGAQTVFRTLSRWGCFDSGKLTVRGHLLLSTLDAKSRAASCRHGLTELLATKPRSLDGAKRVCAACGSEVWK